MTRALAPLALLLATAAAPACANVTSDEAPIQESLVDDGEAGPGAAEVGAPSRGEPSEDEPNREVEPPSIDDPGEPCGPTPACPSNMVCCNQSCGLCAPPDGYCTKQVCSDA